MSENNSSSPQQAQVVLIGGGVIECSVAYHLADMGLKDVVLIECYQLPSGTTWHAPGLPVLLCGG
jgi:glycine/D-amino acid oxidase-like deaminating enzyme